MLPLLFISLLIACCTNLHAQTPPDDDLEPLLEHSLQSTAQEEEDSNLADELERYRRRPMNLRTTTADSLARLPGISIQEAFTILAFVDSTAPQDISQLELIETLDAEQLRMLRTYTTLQRTHKSAPRLALSVRTRFQQDLQRRSGYTDSLMRVQLRRAPGTGDSLGLDTIPIGSSYLGGRSGMMTRILADYGDFSAGITFEKDPGEPILYADTTAFSYHNHEHVDPAVAVDGIERRFGGFVSGHAAAKFGGLTIHAGDYAAEFGQGLLLRTASGGGMAGDAYRPARGITSYRSAGEIAFLRGVAIGFRPENPGGHGLGAHLFWSHRLLDASLEESISATGTPVLLVTSLREDGYRRTRSELRRSGNLTETLFGGNLVLRFRGGDIGVTAYTSAYSAAPAPDLIAEYGPGRTTMVSIDGRYARWGALLFGEIARAGNGTLGAIGGIAGTIGRMDVAITGRWLPPAFATPHGSGFGESPLRQRNEHGIHIAAKAPVLHGLVLATYLDIYRIPERTALFPFARNGADGCLQMDFTPVPTLTLGARLRSESKEMALTITDASGRDRRRIVERTSTSGRLSVEYATRNGVLRLRARIERRFTGSDGGIPASDGMLTFADIRLRPVATFSLAARTVLFDTDDFDAAIHEFEQDVPGRMTNIALYGEGRRFYAYLSWHPSAVCSIAMKYAETVFTGRTLISAGTLQEIAGPISSSVAMQVDLMF